MAELIGRVFGQYRIVAEIGHGGMADVYRAEQPSIGREVAIKILPAQFLKDRSFIERFDREVKIIAQLQHPRILPVFDYGETDQLPYIVMAYAPGGSLADRIRQSESGLPLEEVSRLISQIAEGMDFAHEQGIIHRDFKPSNVLLDHKGNSYLADFGIARVIADESNLTGSGTVGTPAYMAPEMAHQSGVTPLVDIYALGITLFEMLTGQHPYKTDTPMGVLLAHVNQPVPRLESLAPDLPASLQIVIEKAMAKDPARRYQTASALAHDLADIVQGKAISSKPDDLLVSSVDSASLGSRTSPSLNMPQWGWIFLGLTLIGSLIAAAVWFADPALPVNDPVAYASESFVLSGHTARINQVEFSNDSTTLASTSDDDSVILWDARTGRQLRTLKGHTESVLSVAFSPVEPLLATASADNSIMIWDLRTGEAIHTLKGHESDVLSVAFSPDGLTLVSGSTDCSMILWDVPSGSLLRVVDITPQALTSVAFSLDGLTMASGDSDGTVSLYDIRSDDPIHIMTDHTDSVNDVALSPDGRLLASGSSDTGIILWDVATGEEIRKWVGASRPILSVEFSADGLLLASTSISGDILIWEVATGEQVSSLPLSDSWALDLDYAPDGMTFASAALNHSIIIWNINP